jgi:hypothetical protein
MYHFYMEDMLETYGADHHIGLLVRMYQMNQSVYEVLPYTMICDLDKLIAGYESLRRVWSWCWDDDTYSQPSEDLQRQHRERFQNFFEECPEEQRLVCLVYFLYRVASRQVVGGQRMNIVTHQETLRPFLQNHIFEDVLLNPNYNYIIMYMISILLDRNRGNADDQEEYEDEILEEFYEAFIDVKRNFLATLRMRTGFFKKPLAEAVFHPDRVEKWLEIGGHALVEMMF